MNSLQAYRDDNKRFVDWFYNVHRPLVVEALGFEHRKEDVVLTGSRSTGLAYPNSDMEYAVIVDDATTEDERGEIATQMLMVYNILNGRGEFGTRDLRAKQIKTKAGLPLLILTNLVLAELPLTKLEMTVRTRSQQAKIVANDAIFLQRPEEELFRYIQDIEKAHNEGNQERYLQLKEWQRVL